MVKRWPYPKQRNDRGLRPYRLFIATKVGKLVLVPRFELRCIAQIFPGNVNPQLQVVSRA